jgi:hypothetical protein
MLEIVHAVAWGDAKPIPLLDLAEAPTSGGLFEQVLAASLPLAVGVFLGLWLLAPIASELRAFHVAMRSILAIGVGSTLHFIVAAVLGAIFVSSVTSSLDFIPHALGFALQSAVSLLIHVLPLGILASVLAWVWLTAHPPKHQVSGMLDEV